MSEAIGVSVIRAMSKAIGALLLIAAASRAQQPCPYLNSATAAGVLDGEVTSQVNGDMCLFTHNSAQLHIEVRTANPPYKVECGPNQVTLTAIGNEAVACSLHGNNGRLMERITGRVRDRIFFVRLTSNDLSRTALREKARSVAEQVAGILF
jgi:hypothetical protein